MGEHICGLAGVDFEGYGSNENLINEEDKRIVLVECVMNYTDLPEECILEIGYLKRKFKLVHIDSATTGSGIYKLKFIFERVEDINKKDEWWDSFRSIVR